jgi:hypothetical protein
MPHPQARNGIKFTNGLQLPGGPLSVHRDIDVRTLGRMLRELQLNIDVLSFAAKHGWSGRKKTSHPARSFIDRSVTSRPLQTRAIHR